MGNFYLEVNGLSVKNNILHSVKISCYAMVIMHDPSYVLLVPLRWKMMTDCWSKNPHQRPHFHDIVKTLFDLLDSDTAYLKL